MFATVYKLEMPALSPTMSEGNIISWSKKEGDLVKVGDIVCEIQTDKATMGFESQEEGYLAKIFAPKDTKGVEVGKLIGLLVEEQKDIAGLDLSKYAQTGAASPKAAETAKPQTPSQTQSQAAPTAAAVTELDFHNEYHALESKFKIAPSASYYLKTYHILPTEVKATGPKNFIQKGDVLKFISSQKLEKGQKRTQPKAVEPKVAPKVAAP